MTEVQIHKNSSSGTQLDFNLDEIKSELEEIESETSSQWRKIEQLEKSVDAAKVSLSEIQSRMVAQAKLMESLMAFSRIFTRDIEVRLETIISLAQQKSLWTKAETETELDKQRGVEVKTSAIDAGDIVWLSFEADDGSKTTTQEEFPVRIGLKTIPFDKELIGKMPHSSFEFTKEFKDGADFPDLKGKKVKFKVQIKQVKREIKNEKSGV